MRAEHIFVIWSYARTSEFERAPSKTGLSTDRSKVVPLL